VSEQADGPSASHRHRTDLPTTLDQVPPVGPGYDESVGRALEDLGLDIPAPVLEAVRAHVRLLLAWNEAINLTAIRDPGAVAILHVADSLSALPVLAGERATGPLPPALLDLGSGTGFPGLALGAALPAGRLTLVDSVAKKARFLAAAAGVVAHVLSTSGLAGPQTEVHAERAEDLAQEPEHRESYDLVTARAVGSLAEVSELGLPFLRQGGVLVAWKRERDGNLRQELREAGAIVRAAGGARIFVMEPRSDLLAAHRLVVVHKARQTPARFPRPPAIRRSSRPSGA
jgi:16S rRNA (guanine527-N7)-methyltransferase